MMANGGKGEIMKTVKGIFLVVSLVAIIVGPITSGLTAYWKLKLEMQAKFAVRDMVEEKRHNEVMLILSDISNDVDWTKASVEVVAEGVPFAIERHEYKMHPKEYHSDSSPTEIQIKLPAKPKKVSKEFRPKNMKWVRPE
jgi:hypothetical protein